ncbi:MAG: GNAT family acetyltransferase [Verrucomicrobiota bacterium]
MSEAATESNAVIRLYQPGDREQIRTICCETGFLGKAVDPVFEDRELFADFLTSYYTDQEPECAVVLEVDGKIMGYILGARNPEKQAAFDRQMMPERLWKVLKGYAWHYRQPTRDYIHWLLWRGWREVPETPEDMAHMHINLLPEHKNVQQTKEMIEFFLRQLVELGEKAVYGQIVTFTGKRGVRMFARYGFEVIDSVEVTKFKKYTDRQINLFTVVRDLSESTGLYGEDLWDNKKEQEA